MHIGSGSGPVFIKLAETKFCLKSQVLVSNLRLFLVSDLLAIHRIVETKFSLKLKTGMSQQARNFEIWLNPT